MKKILPIILALLISTIAFGASEWDKDSILSTTLISDTPALLQVNDEALDRVITNYREDAKLKYNTSAAVTIGAGEIVCSNSAGTLRRFRKNVSTVDNVWTVTTNGLDTGVEASATTYYVYAICDADAETFTILLSTSGTNPSTGTYYTRIGYFYNDGSSDITNIVNDNIDHIITSGTIAHGATISLPSGYDEEECAWMTSVNYLLHSDTGGSNNTQLRTSADGTRVVTARAINNISGTINGTANYLIACWR